MLFTDRFDAALKLMPCLRNHKNEGAIIYAVPGGGVPIGYYLAKDYNLPMELMLSKRISHPGNGTTIGAVNMNDYFVEKRTNFPASFIKNEIRKIQKDLKERHRKFMDGRETSDAKNKIVYLVDDGAATGSTLLAAIKQLKDKNPKKIIIAIPVAPEATINKLKQEVDEVICLRTIKSVIGVGNNYLNYSQVTDKEIYQLLNACNDNRNIAA
ncbi:MAG: phosphoribosyltransferase [Bacteroidota bacterium]|nr:phosphoribosyltransferase [Bacteroidota bacterium]